MQASLQAGRPGLRRLDSEHLPSVDAENQIISTAQHGSLPDPRRASASCLAAWPLTDDAMGAVIAVRLDNHYWCVLCSSVI